MAKKFKIGDKVKCGFNGEYIGYIKELGTPKRVMYVIKMVEPTWQLGKFTCIRTCHEWELTLIERIQRKRIQRKKVII